MDSELNTLREIAGALLVFSLLTCMTYWMMAL